MPIPAAACIIATTVFAHPMAPDPTGDPFVGWMLLVIVLLISLLMVSRLRYRSFKELDLKARKSHKYLLIPAAALAAVMLNPQIVLMVVAYAYLLSGILPRRGTSRQPVREMATGVTPHGGGDDAD
jgi:CDP-diacylglycerol--serine O-phosphatidyltransferase